jgi:transcriptional antiterminator RfaH
VPAPLFPRYLFVAIDLETERWRAVRSTVGVSELILKGDQPAPVPRGVVEDIRAREDERGYVRLRPRLDLVRGAAIEVTDGPLCGASGIFECAADEERVVVLLDLLGRQVRTRVPLETVRLSA